jgi:hypothetical protein
MLDYQWRRALLADHAIEGIAVDPAAPRMRISVPRPAFEWRECSEWQPSAADQRYPPAVGNTIKLMRLRSGLRSHGRDMTYIARDYATDRQEAIGMVYTGLDLLSVGTS